MSTCSDSDHDHNGIITEDEFAALPLGEVAEEFKKFDLDWQEERRQEYRKLIDVNHDGQTDVAELRVRQKGEVARGVSLLFV